MRQWIDLFESNEPRIVADIGKEVALIHDFYIPQHMRGKGMGRRYYEEWEASLPETVELVKLFAADYDGSGNSDGFWDALGFSYAYTGDTMSYEAEHTMWKGVNGHPTPPPVDVDDEEDYSLLGTEDDDNPGPFGP